MRRALLAAAVLLLLLPGVAGAAPDTVITFEGLVPESFINTQYDASDGVTFGKAQDFGITPAGPQCFAPRAVSAGISGQSAHISCSPGELAAKYFGAAFEFSFERRAVSFRLRQTATSGPLDARIDVYGIGAALLETRVVSLLNNVTQTVAFSRPTSQIAAIVISGHLGYDYGPVQLDDLVASNDDIPPPPKFALALSEPSAEVVEGSTAAVPISVRRFNGSTGPVNIAIGTLPPGIVAAQVDPNPLAGKAAGALRVTAGSPFSGERQLPVSASGGGAGTAVVSQLVQTFTGVPAIQISSGGRSAIRLVPGCGPQTVADGFSVRGGYFGTVNVSAGSPTGGLTATVPTPSVFALGNGTYPVNFSLDPGGGDGSGQFDFNANPNGATPASLKLSWLTDRVKIERVSPVSRPIVAGGQTATVLGNFPPGCAVTFQDGAGQPWQVKSRTQVDLDGRLVDGITLDPPTSAVSGPLRVLSPSGAELARAQVDVTDFRNVYALSQANSGPGATTGSYSWADFERTFGTDDTDACFVFCVRDPIASDYYDQIRASVTSGNGLCAGWSIMAMRFRGFGGIEQRPTDYQPGATRAWQIAPASDGTAVKRDVVRWHTAQNDKGFGAQRATALGLAADAERQLLRDLLAQQRAAYIGIRQGNNGHALVAYAAQETGGGMTVSVYDPNVPYSTAEESPPSTVRTGALNQSTIVIDSAGGWRGSSLSWSGNNSTLGVFASIPPTDADLPSTFSLVSLFNSSGGAAPAEVTAIASGGTAALGAGGEPRAGSGVTLQPVATGVNAEPQYELDSGREYELIVRGTRAGRYSQGLLGKGVGATVNGAPTAPGQQDTLTLRPGQAQLGFQTGAASAPVIYELRDKSGKATRSASIAMTARRGAGDEAELGGGVLRITHAGAATTATITLSSVGGALPDAGTTAPLRIGRGQRLELKPRSWSNLAAGIRLTVRNRAGRVVRRANIRLRTTAKVALRGVAARRRGTKLTITGSVAKRGSAPLLAGVAEIVRGSRVLRRRSVTRRGTQVKAGRFSLPLTIGRVPGGAQVRVRVTLLDEAAGLANVKRIVRAR